MASTPLPDNPGRLRRLWDFCLRPGSRYAAAWVVALGLAGGLYHYAWHGFDSTEQYDRHGRLITPPARNDGNIGHGTIDFGGQYLMGRMLVRGYGDHLYHRPYQRRVLSEVYPLGDEQP